MEGETDFSEYHSASQKETLETKIAGLQALEAIYIAQLKKVSGV
jgi:hypothetical protein